MAQQARKWSELSLESKRRYRHDGVTPAQYNSYQRKRAQGYKFTEARKASPNVPGVVAVARVRGVRTRETLLKAAFETSKKYGPTFIDYDLVRRNQAMSATVDLQRFVNTVHSRKDFLTFANSGPGENGHNPAWYHPGPL